MNDKLFHHALKIDRDLCTGCTHCISVCPTEALRIKDGKAILNKQRCVDCGECYKECPVSAIKIEHDDFDDIFKYKHRIALFPSVMISQFPDKFPPKQIYSTLLELGFTHVYEVEHSVDTLKEISNNYQSKHPEKKPLISTFCPAIVRLIQVKYPSLVDNLLLIKPPFDLAAYYYKKKLISTGIKEEEIGIFYITPCAAKIAAVKSPVGEKISMINGVINLDSIYNKVFTKIKNKQNNTCRIPDSNSLSKTGVLWSLTKGEADNSIGRSLAIDGIRNVTEFLEKLENEEFEDLDFLELRACDESCAGGVLTVSNRFLTVERMKNRANQLPKNKIANKEKREILLENIELATVKPRSIDKLDDNLRKAMQKMEKKSLLINTLPGFDCGACGAPSCQALADDIVQGRAKINHCIFVQNMKLFEGYINKKEAKKTIEDIWGKERINTREDLK
ncbi:MAG: [Fe-Fe] hydrogenase large subunit C-terminal domain-containing protein [Bacteroidota bacterium]|nr:[Fe-Fe] hydrogenase large subunit C-terminal domain-containing protein [Bacteroidota bacterium]